MVRALHVPRPFLPAPPPYLTFWRERLGNEEGYTPLSGTCSWSSGLAIIFWAKGTESLMELTV